MERKQICMVSISFQFLHILNSVGGCYFHPSWNCSRWETWSEKRNILILYMFTLVTQLLSNTTFKVIKSPCESIDVVQLKSMLYSIVSDICIQNKCDWYMLHCLFWCKHLIIIHMCAQQDFHFWWTAVVQHHGQRWLHPEMKWLLVAFAFHRMFPHTLQVNGYQQLFGCQHSSKYLILCLTEEINSYCWSNTRESK